MSEEKKAILKSKDKPNKIVSVQSISSLKELTKEAKVFEKDTQNFASKGLSKYVKCAVATTTYIQEVTEYIRGINALDKNEKYLSMKAIRGTIYGELDYPNEKDEHTGKYIKNNVFETLVTRAIKLGQLLKLKTNGIVVKENKVWAVSNELHPELKTLNKEEPYIKNPSTKLILVTVQDLELMYKEVFKIGSKRGKGASKNKNVTISNQLDDILDFANEELRARAKQNDYLKDNYKQQDEKRINLIIKAFVRLSAQIDTDNKNTDKDDNLDKKTPRITSVSNGMFNLSDQQKVIGTFKVA